MGTSRWTAAGAVVVACVSIERSARADDEPQVDAFRTPIWSVAIGGGVGAGTAYDDILMDNTLQFPGMFGGTVDLHYVRGPIGVLGQGDIYPVGDMYGGRGGVILGAPLHLHYKELIGSQQVAGGTLNTYEVSSGTLAGVVGLDLGVGGHTFKGHSATTLEAGFGFLGQELVEVQYLFDATNSASGMRMRLELTQGQTVSIVGGFEMEFWVGNGLPYDGTLLFTIGVGGGALK